jgi:hypothetical protein
MGWEVGGFDLRACLMANFVISGAELYARDTALEVEMTG